MLLDSGFFRHARHRGRGRRVINNIQQAATLFLVKNIFSLGAFAAVSVYQLAIRLVPVSERDFVPDHRRAVFFLAMEPKR